MAWLVNEHLERNDRGGRDERSAYVAGYNDAWYGYARWTSNMPDFHPSHYSDGYAAGHQDRAQPSSPLASP